MTRQGMRMKAFEAGIELIEDPAARASVIAGTHEWWKGCAALTPDERRKVLSDVQQFARAEEERIRTAQDGE